MIRNLFTGTLAAGALSLGVAAPAHAAPDDGYTEHVMWISSDTACAKTPGAIGPGIRPADIATHATTGAIYPATGIRDAYFYGGHRQVKVGKTACFIDDWSTAVVKGEIDPAKFTATLLAPDEEHSGALLAEIGGQLVSPTVYALPSGNASTLGELDTGNTIVGAGWQTEGANSITGRAEWTPVSWAGTLAWIPAASVAQVPEHAVADLTGTLTPGHTLTVHEAPTSHSEVAGSLAAGVEVAALTTPWAGWLPVEVDGRVGWVAQSDLVAPKDDPEETPSPSATATEPGLIDRGRERLADFKADREEAKAERQASGEPSLWQRAKEFVTQDNVVARGVAKAALRLAAILGGVSLILALIGLTLTPMARRRPGVTDVVNPTMLVIAHASLPAAIIVGLWASMVAPDHHFTGTVLAGAVVLGAALGGAVAHRVVVMRGVDPGALVDHVRSDWAKTLVAAGFVGLAAHAAVGVSLAACVVLGLVVAGVVAGVRTPMTQAVARVPAHLPHEAPEPVATPEPLEEKR